MVTGGVRSPGVLSLQGLPRREVQGASASSIQPLVSKLSNLVVHEAEVLSAGALDELSIEHLTQPWRHVGFGLAADLGEHR